MSKRLDRRWMAPALCLACLILQTPLRMLLSGALSAIRVSIYREYLSAMLCSMLLWLPAALLLLPWRTRRLGSQQDRKAVLIAALPLGMLLQWGITGLRTWLSSTAAATLPAPQSPAEWLLAVLALAVTPALCEEAFFRGGLLSHLRDVTSPAASFLLCTLIFALMHGSLSGLPAHLLVSAACTLLMLNTGAVLPAMLLHLGFNLMALFTPMLPASPWLTLLLPLGMALLLLLCTRMRWRSSEKHLSRIDAVLLGAVLAGCILRYLIP